MAKKKKETIVDKEVNIVVEPIEEEKYQLVENAEEKVETLVVEETELEFNNGDPSVVAPKEEENKPKEEKKNKSLFDLYKGFNFSDSWNGQVIDF